MAKCPIRRAPQPQVDISEKSFTFDVLHLLLLDDKMELSKFTFQKEQKK